MSPPAPPASPLSVQAAVFFHFIRLSCVSIRGREKCAHYKKHPHRALISMPPPPPRPSLPSPLSLQAAVLLLFNSADRLSYADIRDQLNLSDEDVVRLLHSLACAKYKVLLKTPDSKMVEHSDVFSYNAGFTDKMRRIKVCGGQREGGIEGVDCYGEVPQGSCMGC